MMITPGPVTRGQLVHLGKLLCASVPAVVVALAPNFTAGQFNTGMAATALMVAGEFVAHGWGGSKTPPTTPSTP